MGRGPEAVLDQVEVVLQPLAFQVLCVGVPAHAHLGVVGELHYLFHDGKRRALPVHLQADLLPVVGTERAHDVQRFADLLDGLLPRNVLLEAVGLHLDAAGAHVVTELDEGLGGFDSRLEPLGVGVVESFVAAQADQGHRAVGEPLLDLHSLAQVERRLDAVGVGCTKLHAKRVGRFAVADQRREVPILAPVVGHQPEGHLRARLLGPFGRPSAQRSGGQCGGDSQRSSEETTAGCIAHRITLLLSSRFPAFARRAQRPLNMATRDSPIKPRCGGRAHVPHHSNV